MIGTRVGSGSVLAIACLLALAHPDHGAAQGRGAKVADIIISGCATSEGFVIVSFAPAGAPAEATDLTVRVENKDNDGKAGLKVIAALRESKPFADSYEVWPSFESDRTRLEIVKKTNTAPGLIVVVAKLWGNGDDPTVDPKGQVYSVAYPQQREASHVAAPAAECRFETAPDGSVTLADVDGSGTCTLPDKKNVVRGTLHVRTCQRVLCTGTPIIEAEAVVLEPGATLVGESSSLRSLTLVTLTGDVVNHGSLTLGAADDLVVTARRGSIDFGDVVRLEAADRIVVHAKQGDVVLAPGLAELAPQFTLLGRNRVEILATGAGGRMRIERSRIGGKRLLVSTRANVSVVGQKELRLADSAELTTDVTETSLAPVPGNVDVMATGPVVVVGSELDSGRNVRIQTRPPGDGLCLDGATLQARSEAGVPAYVDLRGVRGPILDTGSSAFDGIVLGTIGAGACP